MEYELHDYNLDAKYVCFRAHLTIAQYWYGVRSEMVTGSKPWKDYGENEFAVVRQVGLFERIKTLVSLRGQMHAHVCMIAMPCIHMQHGIYTGLHGYP